MFVDDIEKMSDFLIETEDNFLQQYSYLTQKEYNETKKYSSVLTDFHFTYLV